MGDNGHKTDKRSSERAAEIIESLMNKPLPEDLKTKIRDWMGRHENEGVVAEALDKVFEHGLREDPDPSREVIESYEKIRRMLGFPEDGAPAEKRTTPLRRMTWRRAAAVLIPVVVIAGLGLWLNNRSTTAPETPDMVIAAGESLREATLPDGSEVLLQPGSTLTCYGGFENGREAALTGEAFFRVARQDGKTFRVRTGEMTVTVLGTEFRLQAYEQTGRSSLTLHSGSVEVEAGSEKAVLAPGEQIKYYHDTRTVDITNAEPEDPSKPSMDFYNRSLNEIFTSLELNYGVKCICTGTVPDRGYTIRFTPAQDAGEAMRLLSLLAQNFSYRIDGDSIRINFNAQ